MSAQVTFKGATSTVSTSLPPFSGGGIDLVGIYIPAGWAGTSITFQVSADQGATFGNVIVPSTGAAYTVTTANGSSVEQYIPIPEDAMRGVGAFTLQLTAAEQTAGPITLTLVFE
jgi:hypothetical protein